MDAGATRYFQAFTVSDHELRQNRGSTTVRSRHDKMMLSAAYKIEMERAAIS